MTTLLLFTLGTGRYSETTYQHADQAFACSFAAQALCEFHNAREPQRPVERAIVWVTPGARATNLAALQSAWDTSKCPLETRDLATPGGEAEFWDLFDSLAAAVADGDRVLLDITHGFRTMPIVAMLAIAYLRAVRRDVTIAMVGYGQFTPGETVTPYLDLLPLVSLLDWTHGVQRLRESGDARPLAALLKAAQHGAHTRAKVEGWATPKLKSTAMAMERLALALQTLRFDELAKSASSLNALLGELGPADRQGARPFFEIADALAAEVAPLAASDGGPPLTDMGRHHSTLVWLYDRGLYFPYLGLLTESLIAHVADAIHLNGYAEGDLQRLKEVHHFASVIMTGARLAPDGSEREVRPWLGGSSFHRDVLATLDQAALRAAWRASPHHDLVAPFSEQVGNLRNSLMHAGFSVSEAPAEGAKVVKTLADFHAAAMALPIWR